MDLYAAAGVDYDVLDAGKRAAVAAAFSTTQFSHARGALGDDSSRGEPAFLFRLGNQYLATVLECLGTKSTIARQVQEETGANHFDAIGYDSVAAIVNDMICVGALPLVINAYFATGAPEWYSAEGRFEALVKGWTEACKASGAAWGGGESPGLSGIIAETEIDLAGSCVGAVPAGVAPLNGNNVEPDDEIVLIASNGLHANGSSLARKIANESPDRWMTKLESGQAFGDAVLAPSVIYVDLVDALLDRGTKVSYVSHITGHGFRKLMRADKEVTYRITEVPPVPEVLQFMAETTNMTEADAYGTFNMGAGLAVYCREGSSAEVIDSAKQLGHEAWLSGVVEEGPRRVIVEPFEITYGDEDLQLR